MANQGSDYNLSIMQTEFQFTDTDFIRASKFYVVPILKEDCKRKHLNSLIKITSTEKILDETYEQIHLKVLAK